MSGKTNEKRMHTVNEVVGAMATRAAELVAMGVNDLRAWHPDNIGETFPVKYTKAECVEAILVEEFSQVFDVELAESVVAYREGP